MPYNKNHLPPIKLNEVTRLKVPLSKLEIRAIELARRISNVERVKVNYHKRKLRDGL